MTLRITTLSIWKPSITIKIATIRITKINAECCYNKFRTFCNVNAAMLSVIMGNVVRINVVAPKMQNLSLEKSGNV